MVSSSTAQLLKMGLISCPKMSVTNYQSTLLNIPEEQRSLKEINTIQLLTSHFLEIHFNIII